MGYTSAFVHNMSQFAGKTRLAYSRAWHAVDLSADPRPLGRVASSIAICLMGKHKPIYDPSTDCGDYVVVTGCTDLHTTGKKRFQKKYYSHTTRPGSLKEITMDKMMAKWGGSEILRRAVRGMLPKNRLRDYNASRDTRILTERTFCEPKTSEAFRICQRCRQRSSSRRLRPHSRTDAHAQKRPQI